MEPVQTHAAHLALAGFTISSGAVVVSGLSFADQVLRMGASTVAIITGIAALVFYGRQNGWWK